MNRVWEGVRLNLQAFVRTPLNLVLAILVPLVVIEGWGQAMAGLPSLPTVEAIPLELGRMLGAVFGVAIIAGLLGLVQMIQARAADRRLIQAGFPARTLLATRLLMLTVIAIALAGLNFAVLTVLITPEAPLVAFTALALAGIIYALMGALVGAVMPRLFEGSLVVVFLAMTDAFLSGDSPLAADVPDFVEFFPLYHPKAALESAVLDGTVATGDFVFVIGYLVVLLALVTTVFTLTMQTDGRWVA